MNTKKFLKTYYKHIIIVVLFALSVNMSTHLAQAKSEYFSENLDRSIGTQIMGQFLGELRTILAAYLKIRADLYHHERQKNVYWANDPVTLPLHRLVTSLDPHQVEAYDFGGYHLAINFKKYKEGIEFINEGLKYNPNSFKLNHTLGEIYYVMEDWDKALNHYTKAMNLAHKKTEMANSLRRIVWVLRKEKRYDEALEYARMWEKMDPTDRIVRKHMEEITLLKDGKTTEEELRQKARNKIDGKKKNTEIPEKKLKRMEQMLKGPRGGKNPVEDEHIHQEEKQNHEEQPGHDHDHGHKH
ncbi:MAG: tetratricopeptide repeat protein [Vulcanimicrobiota bacterium]